MSDNPTGLFPLIRMRRTRRSASLRALVAETTLSPADLIYPVFVLDGHDRTQEVVSMPGIKRRSIDGLLEEAEVVHGLGIPAIALFPVIDADKKSLDGAECANPDGLVQRAANTDRFRRGKPIVDPLSREVVGYELERVAMTP